jgi:hypothetical protein
LEIAQTAVQLTGAEVATQAKRPAQTYDDVVIDVGGHDTTSQRAVQELLALQEAYQEWLDNLPENLQGTALAEKLLAVCELDIEETADIALPLEFGRD